MELIEEIDPPFWKTKEAKELNELIPNDYVEEDLSPYDLGYDGDY